MWQPEFYPPLAPKHKTDSRLPSEVLFVQIFAWLSVEVCSICIFSLGLPAHPRPRPSVHAAFVAELPGKNTGPLRWICDFAVEVFITDNYIRMCWKRNKPRTVWVGRCWAHTVPSARCSPASNSPAPAGPLGAWKGSRENTEAPPSQNRLVFDSSPCPSFTSLSSRALSTVQHSELQAQEVGFHYFYSPVTSQMLKIQCILWTSLKMIKCSIEWVILNNYNIITVIDNTYNRKQ